MPVNSHSCFWSFLLLDLELFYFSKVSLRKNYHWLFKFTPVACSRGNPSLNTLVQHMQADLNKQIIVEFNMKLKFLLVINFAISKLSWVVKRHQYFCINYC